MVISCKWAYAWDGISAGIDDAIGIGARTGTCLTYFGLETRLVIPELLAFSSDRHVV